MLSLPDSIAIASAFAPVTVYIWRRHGKKKAEIVLLGEFERMSARVEDRFDALERDVRRIAVKLGLDLWGS